MQQHPTPSVTINPLALASFITSLESTVTSTGLAYSPWSLYHLDPNSCSLEHLFAYIFIVDAMNFCFWPGDLAPGEFEYEHMTKNLAKILVEDPKLFEAEAIYKTFTV